MSLRSSVYVVTVSEQFPCHGNDFKVFAFSTMDKAVAWIEAQIELLVANENLTPDAVDGWFIEIGGVDHTIQYDVHELEVL